MKPMETLTRVANVPIIENIFFRRHEANATMALVQLKAILADLLAFPKHRLE